jgi:hypothetical protein
MNILDGTTAVQASTNSYALVGSIVDASMAIAVSFTIKNTGAQTILWEVLAGNTSNLSDGVAVSAPATLASNAFTSYAVTPAPYAYYGLYIKANVNDQHGTATIKGIAKG